jgi:hypothetical protein
MAIKIAKSFNNSHVELEEKQKNYTTRTTKGNSIKQRNILTDKTLNEIRDNPNFTKEHFYSLNLCLLNEWLNRILKNEKKYELASKADKALALVVYENYIRIQYFSQHIFKIKLNRFKVTLYIIHNGIEIFEGTLAIKQDELELIENQVGIVNSQKFDSQNA